MLILVLDLFGHEPLGAQMDSLLSEQDVEEALSSAYAHAVAASAGYVVALKAFDRDGIDMTIEAGDTQRPKLDIQLKATVNLPVTGANFAYVCKQRNYDLLRIQTQTPRILVVLHLPPNRGDWLSLGHEGLILRNCAYWICLTGEPENENTTATTVYIPQLNRFNTEGLKALMILSRSGSLR